MVNFTPELFHVIDNIYLSNLINATNFDLVKSNNINIVIRLSEDNNKNIYDDSVIFYNFEIEDNLLYKDTIIEYSKNIYAIILDNPDKNILIHCNEGQSRSVSVIIYYLCKHHNFNFENAYNYIKNIKSDIRPCNAFIFELRKLFDPQYANKYNSNLTSIAVNSQSNDLTNFYDYINDVDEEKNKNYFINLLYSNLD